MRKRKYTKEIMEKACIGALSFSDVLRNLGLNVKGSDWQRIRRYLAEYGIEGFQKSGHGWSKGKTRETDSRVEKQAQKISHSNEVVFSLNSPANVSGLKLTKRLLKIGWNYSCSMKGCLVKDTWLGKPVTLHLDHINGDKKDNRLENLRFLCPNCHQQTPTWGNKKRACIPTAEKSGSEPL